MSFFLAEMVYGVVGMGLYKAYTYDWGTLNKNFSFLSNNTIDMTALAKAGRLRRAYGREKELVELKGKAAGHGIVLVVGDPGIGKTVLIEELAATFADRRVLKLDYEKVFGSQGLQGLLQSAWNGTGHSALKKLVREFHREFAKGKNHEFVLFIDEFDRLLEAYPDIFNSFLDEFDRSFAIIGVTTEKQKVEDWKAGKMTKVPAGLARRIYVISVKEFSPEESRDVLRQVCDSGQKEFKDIQIEDAAITAAVQLASQYKPEGRYPHHALELLTAVTHAAKGQKKAQISDRDILDHLEYIRSIPKLELERMIQAAKKEIETRETFKENYFPSVLPSSVPNTEIDEAGEHLFNFFSLPHDQRKQRAVLVSASRELMRDAASSFFKRADRIVVRCSLKDLWQLATENRWVLPDIRKTFFALRDYGAVLLIEEGNFLIPYLTASKRTTSHSSNAPVDQIMGLIANQVAPSAVQAARQVLPVEITNEPASLSTTALSRVDLLFGIANALNEISLDYILTSKCSVENFFSLTIKEFDFFEKEDWLTRKLEISQDLVRKTLYAVTSLKLVIGDKKDPLDVAYEILSKMESTIKHSIIQRCPGTRGDQIDHAFRQSDQLESDLFEKPARNSSTSRSLSRALSTFLGRSSQQYLRIEGASTPHTRAWVEKQIASFAQGKAFLVLDLDKVKEVPVEVQEAFLRREIDKLTNSEAKPILGFREEDLEKEFVKKAFLNLVSQGWDLALFSKRARVVRENSSLQQAFNPLLQQAGDAIQNIIGNPQPAPSAQPPQLPSGLEAVPMFPYSLPPLTEADIPALVSSLASTHSNEFAKVYSSLYAESPFTAEELGEHLKQDFAYLRENPGTSLKAYLGEKHNKSENEIAYALDPKNTPWTYRFTRALGQVVWGGGTFLLQPLGWMGRHLSTLSFATFVLGAVRTIASRYLKV